MKKRKEGPDWRQIASNQLQQPPERGRKCRLGPKQRTRGKKKKKSPPPLVPNPDGEMTTEKKGKGEGGGGNATSNGVAHFAQVTDR